jgi:hypothetical protein
MLTFLLRRPLLLAPTPLLMPAPLLACPANPFNMVLKRREAEVRVKVYKPILAPQLLQPWKRRVP